MMKLLTGLSMAAFLLLLSACTESPDVDSSKEAEADHIWKAQTDAIHQAEEAVKQMEQADQKMQEALKAIEQ